MVVAGFPAVPSGSNCGVRASLLRELGGFDETYKLGGDDVEFFWRLQLAGHEICFAADAVSAHRERAGLLSVGRQFCQYGQSDVRLYRDFRSWACPARRLGIEGVGLPARAGAVVLGEPRPPPPVGEERRPPRGPQLRAQLRVVYL